MSLIVILAIAALLIAIYSAVKPTNNILWISVVLICIILLITNYK